MSETIWDRPSGLSLVTKVEVHWTSGPFDNPTSGWTDVTSDVLSFRTKRGRPSENQTTPPGSATIVFNDRDGSYDPTLNGLGGPNAPNVIPGRRVRVTMSDVGSVIEALRPDVYFPLSIGSAVQPSGQLVGTMQAGPNAVQRVRPSGTSDMTQRRQGQWYLENGAFPSVLGFKPHSMETRNGTRFEQGAYIRTDVTAAFGTCSGMAWVTTQSTDATYFCGKYEAFRVGINTAGKAVVDVWLDGDWQGVESTTTIRNTTQWHMVAWTIVWDDATDTVQVRLYVDGEFEAGGEGTGTVSTSTTDRVVVGHMEDDPTLGNANLWDGELCDVAYWSGYALTTPQIERLWQMSDAGMPVFSGHVLSWQVEPRTTPVGNAQVVAECADVAQALSQTEITFDVRRQLLELKPDRLYTFDDDTYEDVLGGPPAQVRGGLEFTNRERTTEQRLSPSISTGVSDGAVTLVAASMVGASIRYPDSTSDMKAFSLWVRAADPDSDDVTLAYGNATISGTLYVWNLQLNTSGRMQLFRQTAVGTTVTETTWEGSRIITNDRWHHIMLRESDVTTATIVFVDGVQDVLANESWNVPLEATFGPKTNDVQIDEVAFWYSTVPSTSTLAQIYEAGDNRYRGQLASARINTICDLAGWSGTKIVSAKADMRCGPLADGDAWRLLQDTAQTEAGTAIVDAQNRLVFNARQDRRRFGELTASALPAGGVADLTFLTDDRYLYNAVTVDGAGEAEDATSIGDYGRRTLSVTPRLWNSTFQAIRAQGLVQLYKDYQPRTDTLRWELPSMFGAVGLLVDVNDMVTVSRTVFPASATADYVQDCWVEAYELAVDAASKRATVTCQLSPVDPQQNNYFTIGTSTFGGTDILGW